MRIIQQSDTFQFLYAVTKKRFSTFRNTSLCVEVGLSNLITSNLTPDKHLLH